MTAMSGRHLHRGTARLMWVTTIADNAAPTVAEINAGTNITAGCAALRGWATTDQTVELPTADGYGRILTARGVKRTLETPTLRYYDEGTDTDTLRETTLVSDAKGYVVWLPYGAPVIGDRCAVWPVISLGPKDQPQADNTPAAFLVGFAIWDLPVEEADIA